MPSSSTASETLLNRRRFLAKSTGLGITLGLGIAMPVSASGAAIDSALAPTLWFEINHDGKILVNITKAEMGQHVGTALARIVADELGADWDDISIKHVDSDPKWGLMITGSSWSVFTSFKLMSQAGAAGREVMRDAGAALLGVAPNSVEVAMSHVTSGERRVSFADIAKNGHVLRTFSAEELSELPIKPAAERRYIGNDSAALDIPAKARGQAIYGIDAELPDMVYAFARLPPTRYGSKIRHLDDSAAKSIKGYVRTLTIDDPSELVQAWAVVVADTYPGAMQAAAAVSIEWDAGPTASVGEQEILQEGVRLTSSKETGILVVDDGNVQTARERAAKLLEATYYTHTALHFTLEPSNALVEFIDGHCHVHAGNQWQSLNVPMLAKSLMLPESQVHLHQYALGGGFGRRLWGDPMIAAAHAARSLGRPVKLVLDRANDSRFDCPRSPSVQKFDASIDLAGTLTGIEHAAAAGWPTLSMAPFLLVDAVDGRGKYDPFSVSGADHWYTFNNHRVRAINNELAHRTFLPGWLRAVGPGWIGWGVECFMDEIAAALGEDPIEFRLTRLDAHGKNAGKNPESVGGAKRLAAVLRDVRERSGWGRVLPVGEGLGVAVCQGQERVMPTWIACVAHVSVDPVTHGIRVKKLWQSIDCGTVVHPDGALAQAEGASLWGVSLALHEGAEFENGEVRQQNLDTYKPLRMADIPELDIRFMDSTEFPTGLGEPPSIPVPPAIGNAIFAATGQRVRSLPIRL